MLSKIDIPLRLPTWARFQPPTDRWVVICSELAFGPFDLRADAKTWLAAYTEFEHQMRDVPLCVGLPDASDHRIMLLEPAVTLPQPGVDEIFGG